MKTNHIERHFASMGARLKSRVMDIDPWRASDYAIDIRRDARGPFFELRVPETLSPVFDATVLNVIPEDRHLLLLLRREGGEARKDRFLCGHDEREWFVAAVPGKASTVREAKQALQPAVVRAALNQHGVRERDRFLRRNEAFSRQGEWFFVPEKWFRAPALLVRRNEPIRRGAGKPHIVEWLYREGGERVYVSSRHPRGVSQERYTAMVKRDPSLLRLDWRVMARNPGVYARGTVRHPDHATLRFANGAACCSTRRPRRRPCPAWRSWTEASQLRGDGELECRQDPRSESHDSITPIPFSSVAQKQSLRLISGRPRSVTARKDQSSQAGSGAKECWGDVMECWRNGVM